MIEINNWHLHPVRGGGICLVGQVAGRGELQTTEVVQATVLHNGTRLLKTETGSVYKLGTEKLGMWVVALESRRPEKVANLRKAGIL